MLQVRRWWRRSRFDLFFLMLVFLVSLQSGISHAQDQNGITSPESGSVVTGVVIIRGTAAHSSFLRFEIAFNNGSEWVVLADGDTPVIDGVLGIWDTSVGVPQAPVFPDGVYELRLRVVREDYNYSEHFVTGLTVANVNAAPTSTSSPSPTSNSLESGSGTRTPFPTVAQEDGSNLPAELPSLTPFPTPSPQAMLGGTVAPGSERGLDGSDSSSDAGLFGQLQAIEFEQFSRAFWQGVKITLALFAAMGMYLVLRAVVRWLWRKMRGRMPL